MSDEKSKVADKASEIAKNIWLAGVGAYGKAVDEAQGRLEKAMEPPKLFRDLVKAGAALEEDAKDVLEGASENAKSSVEQRINRVRENFHMQRHARIEDIVALQKKVDQLSKKVDKLTKALAAGGITPAAGSRQTAATRKTPAKKAVARKKAPAKKAKAKAAPRKKASGRTSTA
jgi:polyhydroxyalkanoate synthesis regulator phasin